MIKMSIATATMALLMAGCVSNRPQPQPVAVAPMAGTQKQILREGGQLVLPDGTRVTPDTTGGFLLPNGDYVRRDRGALILPTGARCVPSSAGYSCP